MNAHRLLLLGGVGLAGLGLVALVAPGVLDADVGYTALVVVAALALVQSLRLVSARRHADLVRERTPDTEEIRTATPPGEELQEAFRQFRHEPHAFYRMSGRPGLRTAAVAALVRYEGLSEEEAIDRVDAGTWTDDRDAAQFLEKGTTHSLSRTVRRWVRGESAYQHGVRRSVDAIAAIAGLAPGESRERSRPAASTDWWDEGHEGDPLLTQDPPEPGLLARRETEHWRGISVVVLASLGVGILFEAPGLLLVGVVGLFYGAYARSHDLEATLSLERSLADAEPAPGDEVEVTVSVTNEGERILPDVRVVDGVPGGLAVTDGSPRVGTALRPGEHVEWTYTVTARRGVHEFDPAFVVVRNAPGTVEHTYGVATAEPTVLTSIPQLQTLPVSVPLRGANTRYAGRQATNASGDGTEFYATRLYRRGDDLSRIDWNRRAKTGELATLLFREERTATVVLLVDTDASAYAAPEAHAEHAVDRSVAAAGRVFETLTEQGHFVGLASLTETDCWLPPGTGPTHRANARNLLGTHPAVHSLPAEDETPIRARAILRRRLPPDAQVIVFSPLCSLSVVRFVRRLDAADHPVTVVSPDATAEGTPSQRLARVGRRVHVTDLRRDGIPVLDWGWDEPLSAALARFEAQGGAQ